MTTETDDQPARRSEVVAGTPLEEVCSLFLVDDVAVRRRNPAYSSETGYRMECWLVNQPWYPVNRVVFCTDWLPSADLAARELRRLVGWWHVCHITWGSERCLTTT